MAELQQKSVRNRLLAGLTPDHFASIQVHLEPVDLELRQVVIEPNQPAAQVLPARSDEPLKAPAVLANP